MENNRQDTGARERQGKSSNGVLRRSQDLVEHWDGGSRKPQGTGSSTHRGTSPGECSGEAARWTGACALWAALSTPGVSCSLFSVGAASGPETSGRAHLAAPGSVEGGCRDLISLHSQHGFHMVVIHYIFVQLMKRENLKLNNVLICFFLIITSSFLKEGCISMVSQNF